MRLLLVLSLLFVASCQDTNSNSLDQLTFGQPDLGNSSSGGGSTATPFQQAMSVVQPKCIGCHTGYHSSWSSYSTEQDWIDAMSAGNDLVVAGDADGSGLIDRLRDWGLGNTGATNMPQAPDPALTATEYGYISDWINSL